MPVATKPKAPQNPATPTPTPPYVPLAQRPFRITVEFFERMVEAGLFGDKSPVILWKGQLFEKMTKNPPHCAAQMKLDRALHRLVPDGWSIRSEAPLAIGAMSMPEPDYAIVRGGPDDYSRRHPAAKDVGFLIEVADTSLADDRGEMLEAYARAGIPTYWIVNLIDRRIEVYSDPSGAETGPAVYRSSRFHGPDERVPIVLDGREVGQIVAGEVLP